MFSLSILVFLFRYKSEFLFSNEIAWNLSGLAIILFSLNQYMAQPRSDLKCLHFCLPSWEDIKIYNRQNDELTHHTEKIKIFKENIK